MNQMAGYIGYQLKMLMNERAITSVFSDPENPDDFIAGYVHMVSAKQCILESVTPYGHYDGFFVMRNNCINEVLHDPVYAERLEIMLKLNRSQPGILPMPEPEEDYMHHVLLWAKEHHRVVTVWTRDDAYTGFVELADDLRLTVGVLDFMGKNPMPVQLALRDIELTSVGAEEERMYEQLAVL